MELLLPLQHEDGVPGPEPAERQEGRRQVRAPERRWEPPREEPVHQRLDPESEAPRGPPEGYTRRQPPKEKRGATKEEGTGEARGESREKQEGAEDDTG